MASNILANDKFTFSASAKIVTFKLPDFNPSKIQQITNVTRGVIIYCPQLNKLGTLNNNVLTLAYDTTSMADTDVLQISYDWEAHYHKSSAFDFTSVVPSGIDTTDLTVIQAGAGQTISQSGGNLVIVNGTTANSETIIRSKIPFSRELALQYGEVHSAPNGTAIWEVSLMDVIGDGLAINVTSTTTAVVSIPVSNPYFAKFKAIYGISTTGMVGQKMFIGAVANVAGAVPQQNSYFTISAMSYTNDSTPITLTFTVSDWTSGSTGTCTLYGWNHIRTYYANATATNKYIDTARNGWNFGIGAKTITTAATAHGVLVYKTADKAILSHTTVTSNSLPTAVGSCLSSIPEEDVPLYLHIICRNGASAATSATWTLSGIRIEESNADPVMMTGTRVNDFGESPLSVKFPLNQAQPVSISSGTVTTVSTVTSVSNMTGYTGSSTSLPATTHHAISAATTNATLVKSSAGNICGGTVSNSGASAAYFKLYNKASAPTVGTDTPVATILIPAGNTVILGNIVPLGFRLTTGIAYALTTGMAIADTGAVALSQISVHLNYA